MKPFPSSKHSGTVRVFGQKWALKDGIELHAFAQLEALPCMWPMALFVWWSSLLPVDAVHCVQTLKGETSPRPVPSNHELCHCTDDVTQH
jgi:hypothetical protein